MNIELKIPDDALGEDDRQDVFQINRVLTELAEWAGYVASGVGNTPAARVRISALAFELAGVAGSEAPLDEPAREIARRVRGIEERLDQIDVEGSSRQSTWPSAHTGMMRTDTEEIRLALGRLTVPAPA